MAVLESLIRKLGIDSRSLTLGHNFRRYGKEFEAYDYDEFIEQAEDFFAQALESEEPGYSVLTLSRGRLAVDYRGETRGIYTSSGTPLAFFKPDYRELGYDSPQQELDDFRAGKSPLFV